MLMFYTGPGDPYFSNTIVLAHFDDANAATTYTNSATTAGSPGLGNQSNTSQIDTSLSKFGSGSLNNNGGRSGSKPGSLASQCNIGTGDFTWEFWYYTPNPSSTYYLGDYGDYNNGHTATGFGVVTTGGNFRFSTQGSGKITGGTVATNTWQAVAVSRVSGSTYLFVNGIQVGSTYADTNTYTGTGRNVWIGGDNAALANSVGHYDEWRITVGVGRYSSNYTPQTAAFPNH